MLISMLAFRDHFIWHQFFYTLKLSQMHSQHAGVYLTTLVIHTSTTSYHFLSQLLTLWDFYYIRHLKFIIAENTSFPDDKMVTQVIASSALIIDSMEDHNSCSPTVKKDVGLFQLLFMAYKDENHLGSDDDLYAFQEPLLNILDKERLLYFGSTSSIGPSTQLPDFNNRVFPNIRKNISAYDVLNLPPSTTVLRIGFFLSLVIQSLPCPPCAIMIVNILALYL